MVIQSIDNILKIIFFNYSKLDLDHLFNRINSKTIALNLLKLLDYKTLFSSLGKSLKLLKDCHNSTISCLLELSDGCIISTSWDKQIKIWNINSGKCIRTLEGHAGFIRSVIMLPNGNIATCSLGGEIRLWNPDEGYQCFQTICVKGHTRFNKLIALSNNNLVSSSYYKDHPYIIILDYNTKYNLINSIKHDGEVGCLVNLFDNKFASGSFKYHITLWDNYEETPNFKILQGHTMCVWCLTFDKKNHLLYSGAADYTIRVWDFKADYECIKIIKAHDDSVTGLLLLPSGLFASGSYDNKIKIWDRNYDCINTLNGGEDYIVSFILLKDFRIASTSNQEPIINIYNY
jgi:WD40 repeat protein